MEKQILFRPRLNFVLAKALTKEVVSTRVGGSISDPKIIEDITTEDLPNWIEVVRSNSSIPDLQEGAKAFFTGRAIEVSYDGQMYLMVKDEDILAEDEKTTA